MTRTILLSSFASLAVISAVFAGDTDWMASATAEPATSQSSPSTQPAAPLPAGVVGKWIYGSISPTTYWDSSSGKFLGNGFGTGEVLIIDANGTYKQYVYIEARTYSLVNKVWVASEGTVEFATETFTLRPVKGHFLTTGGRELDRDWTPEEVRDRVKTYNWKLETDDAGKTKFVIPFSDGSSMTYRKDE
ncbi:MAG: hypothetical protein QM770_02585 [Tepidisphaeraceae bacterium]